MTTAVGRRSRTPFVPFDLDNPATWQSYVTALARMAGPTGQRPYVVQAKNVGLSLDDLVSVGTAACLRCRDGDRVRGDARGYVAKAVRRAFQDEMNAWKALSASRDLLREQPSFLSVLLAACEEGGTRSGLIAQDALASLTPKERQLLVSAGQMKMAAIAADVGLCIRQVQRNLAKAREKAEAATRAAAKCDELREGPELVGVDYTRRDLRRILFDIVGAVVTIPKEPAYGTWSSPIDGRADVRAALGRRPDPLLCLWAAGYREPELAEIVGWSPADVRRALLRAETRLLEDLNGSPSLRDALPVSPTSSLQYERGDIGHRESGVSRAARGYGRLKEMLSLSGVEITGRQPGRGGWINSVRCPKGNRHARGDKQPSARVHPGRSEFHCFTCRFRGNTEAVRAWLATS